MNALGDHVRSLRSRAGSGATVADRRSSLTDGELLGAADETARRVRSRAQRDTPMVAAVLPLSTDALVLLLAAVVGDFSLCFIDPAAPEERRTDVLDALAPDVVVDPDGHDGRGRTPSDPTRRTPARGTSPCRPGSTGGGPKGVLSSWSSIAAFVPHGAEALELDETGTWAEVSHLSYDLAMTNLLIGLAAGCSIRLSSSLGDRLRPLGFTEKVGATHLRLAPRFIDLAVNERPGAGARSLRVWGSGGDRLSAAGARQVFGLGIPTIVNTYGTSETIGFASAARVTAEDALALRARNGHDRAGHGGPVAHAPGGPRRRRDAGHRVAPPARRATSSAAPRATTPAGRAPTGC